MGDGVEEVLYEAPQTLEQVGVRLYNIERKVDKIWGRMNRVIGAWIFASTACGVIVGVATVYAAFK